MTAGDQYSVLMSVNARETPAFLKDSMMSVFEQTLPTDDFVLIEDGALTPGLSAVIKRMKTLFKNRLKVLTLRQVVGRAQALDIGLKECRHELIAYSDSSAISLPSRCARQLKMFEARPVSIVGATAGVFEEDPDTVKDDRRMPEEALFITRLSRKSTPFNKETVMVRKSRVLDSGGYDDRFPAMPDYYLWVRMLMNGCSGYNIPDRLVLARAAEDEAAAEVSARERLAFEKWKREVGWTKLSDYVKGALPLAVRSMTGR